MFNFVCENCGHDQYTTKGYNAARTKRRLVCKNCGKNTTVDLVVFEGRDTSVPEVETPRSETTQAPVSVGGGAFVSSVNVQNAPVEEPVPVITADLENERHEDREPNVPKTRFININGQTGAFPNFTEDMVYAYAQAQNHSFEFKDGVYYLTAQRGAKG